MLTRPPGLLMLVIAAGLRIPCLVASGSASDPSAETILREARLSPTVASAVLNARIRGESGETPLKITLQDRVIRYSFPRSDREIRLRLDEGRSSLSESVGSVTTPVSGSHLHDPVAGTGLSYQDLSLGFLYWPHPVLQGEEMVGIRTCWKIDLQAPAGEALYGVARVWIDKEFGALLKIEAYDKRGLLLRRFQLISPQKINGIWMIKQMRIESFLPGQGEPVTRDYLEVLSKQD